MLTVPFPLIETVPILNKLQWELMVAKMSCLLQVNVLQLIMWLQWTSRKESCGPIPKGPCSKESIENEEDLHHWPDGKETNAWVPTATILLPELPTPLLVAQCHVKGQGYIWPRGKHISSTNTHVQVNQGAPDNSRKRRHEKTPNGNANMLQSPNAMPFALYAHFRWLHES